jgi:hypothetical protein
MTTMFSFHRPCDAARRTAGRVRMTLPSGLCPGQAVSGIEHHVPAIVQRILNQFQRVNGNTGAWSKRLRPCPVSSDP